MSGFSRFTVLEWCNAKGVTMMKDKQRPQNKFLKHYKAIGTKEKMGSKVFSVRLPEDYQDALVKLPKEERIILIRSAIMEAVDKYYEDN